MLHAFGKAGEASSAVGVGADFEVEFTSVHESVGDVNRDLGGVDSAAVGIGHGEVGGAGSDSAIDHGNGLRIGTTAALDRRQNDCNRQYSEPEMQWRDRFWHLSHPERIRLSRIPGRNNVGLDPRRRWLYRY